uniref:Uncharacterized protein n=1 Tax=Tetraselmis sp. GSL018 TaxID=582737 RepID=A0A061RUF2_9CHLO
MFSAPRLYHPKWERRPFKKPGLFAQNHSSTSISRLRRQYIAMALPRTLRQRKPYYCTSNCLFWRQPNTLISRVKVSLHVLETEKPPKKVRIFSVS